MLKNDVNVKLLFRSYSKGIVKFLTNYHDEI